MSLSFVSDSVVSSYKQLTVEKIITRILIFCPFIDLRSINCIIASGAAGPPGWPRDPLTIHKPHYPSVIRARFSFISNRVDLRFSSEFTYKL